MRSLRISDGFAIHHGPHGLRFSDASKQAFCPLCRILWTGGEEGEPPASTWVGVKL